MLLQKDKLKIITAAAFAGCAVFICFKIVSAAWQEPVGNPPENNRPAPVYQQTEAQPGPLNVKGESGAGKIEANSFCVCSGTTGNCSADMCVSSWDDIQGVWELDVSDIYYNAGNVGIGTTDPQSKLHIDQGDVVIGAASAGSQSLIFREGSTNLIGLKYQGGSSGNPLDIYNFQIGGTLMRITETGKVGIGATTLSELLEIRNDVDDAVSRLRITDTNDNSELQLKYGSGDNDHWAMYANNFNDAEAAQDKSLRIWGGGADRLTVLQNGNVGIGTTAPGGKMEINDGAAGVKKLFINDTNNNTGDAEIYVESNNGGADTLQFRVESDGDVYARGNVGIGVSSPLGKLQVEGDVRGHILSSNRYPVGLEYNILFNGNNRYTVSQSGSTSFSLSSIFDGKLDPSYTGDGVNPANPVVILIENLPSSHTQAGAWAGWTTRYWAPKKFKIEGYDTYSGFNDWRMIADYSSANYSGSDYIVKIPTGGVYTKLRFTIIEGSGSAGANGFNRAGLSEIFFIHPEANRLYSGILPSSMWEVNGNVGIGTTNPGAYKLNVNGVIKATSIDAGALTGTVSAGNVSNGAFGSGAGSGHYGFPSRLSVGYGSGSTPTSIGQTGDLSVSGNVGIGTAGPGEKLHLIGNQLISASGDTNDPSQNLTVAGSTFANEAYIATRTNLMVNTSYYGTDFTGWNNQTPATLTRSNPTPGQGFKGTVFKWVATQASDRDWASGGAQTSAFVLNRTYRISFQYTATNSFELHDRDSNIVTVPANTGNAKYYSTTYTKTVDTWGSPYFLVYFTGANTIQMDQLVIQDLTSGTPTYTLAADATGNVGIGTTGPEVKLDISGGDVLIDNNQYLKWERATGGNDALSIGVASDNKARISTAAGNSLTLAADDNGINFQTYVGGWQDRMVIQEAGNVGIGTATPVAKLQVIKQGETVNQILNVLSIGKSGTGAWASGSGVGLVFGQGYTDSGAVSYFSRIVSKMYTSATDYSSLHFQTKVDGETAPSDKMVISNTGNVGIGTSGPSRKLEVADTGTTDRDAIRTTRETHSAGIGVDRNGTYWGTGIYQDGVEKFVIDSNYGVLIGQNYLGSNPPANGLLVEGNLGIGTTEPGAKLHVFGAYSGVFGNDGMLKIKSVDNGGCCGTEAITLQTSIDNRTDDYDISAYGGHSRHILSLQPQGGNVGIGTTTPSVKLDVSGDANVSGTLTVDAISGDYTGLISAGNVSNGAFGSGAGDGHYGFPARLSVGYGSGSTPVSLGQTGDLSVSGNVGIGTTNPNSGKLHIYGGGTATTQIFIANPGNDGAGHGAIDVENGDIIGVNQIYFDDLGEGIKWATANTAATTKVQVYATDTTPSHLVLDSNVNANSGNVGIGTAAPMAKLQIGNTDAYFSHIGGYDKTYDQAKAACAAQGARLANYTEMVERFASGQNGPCSWGWTQHGEIGVVTYVMQNGAAGGCGGATGGVRYSAPAYTATYGANCARDIAIAKGTADITALISAKGLSIQGGQSGGKAFFGYVPTGSNTDAVRLGIGTANPAEAFEVSGNVKATNFIGNFSGGISQVTGANMDFTQITNSKFFMNSYKGLQIRIDSDNNDANAEFAINNGGNEEIFKIREDSVIMTDNVYSFSGTMEAANGWPDCAPQVSRIFDIGTINADGNYRDFIEIDVIGSHAGWNNTNYSERKKFILYVGSAVSANTIVSSGRNNVALWNGTTAGDYSNWTPVLGKVVRLVVNPSCGATFRYTVNVRYSKSLDFTPASAPRFSYADHTSVASLPSPTLNFYGANIGIGTTNPTVKLEVNGAIKATSIDGGTLTGTVSAGNVSMGDFGSLTGGGNYTFPANLGIGGNLTVTGSGTFGGDLAVNGGDISLDNGNHTIKSYSSGNSLWIIDSTDPKVVLAEAHDWDRGVSFKYDPGTTGAGAGILTIGQMDKNDVNYTHGVTAFYTNGAERMRINNAGNVGIGTTGPSYPLTVANNGSQIATTNYYRVAQFTQGTAAQGIGLGYDTTGDAGVISPYGAANDIAFWTYSNPWSEKMRITDSGNVGIGTTNPTVKLEVNGAIKATSIDAGALTGTVSAGNVSAGSFGTNTGGGDYSFPNNLEVAKLIKAQGNYIDVVSYNYNGTPTNGIKIKTNIPYSNGSQMPTILIEGYNYGNAQPIGLSLTWYIYDGNFTNYKVSSWGAYVPTIKLSNENDKVVIFIDHKPYYERFTVRAFAQGMSETYSWFKDWTVADEAFGGSNQVTVPYENRFAGNVYMPGSGIWNSSGNAGIGTTGPGYKLDVSGDIRATDRLIVGDYANSQTNSGEAWLFRAADRVAGTLTVQLGGTSATNTKFEIVDRAWTKVMYSFSGEAPGSSLAVNSSGNVSTVGTLTVSGTGNSSIAGNVGIGTTAPEHLLDVNGAIRSRTRFYVGGTSVGSDASQTNISAFANNGLRIVGSLDSAAQDAVAYQSGSGGGAALAFGRGGGYATYLAFYTNHSTAATGAISEDMRITNSGSVGIGTTSPSALLSVKGAGTGAGRAFVISDSMNTERVTVLDNGNVGISGDLSVGGAFSASGADVAEEFTTEEEIEEGTVVIMGDDGYKSAKPCEMEYDTKVIGVVSDNAAIIMGKVESEHKAVVAITGVVTVKVSIKNGVINKGDLLTTSDVKGYAMKAADPKIGTVIGKALEVCASDRCEIKALINLQ